MSLLDKSERERVCPGGGSLFDMWSVWRMENCILKLSLRSVYRSLSLSWAPLLLLRSVWHDLLTQSCTYHSIYYSTATHDLLNLVKFSYSFISLSSRFQSTFIYTERMKRVLSSTNIRSLMYVFSIFVQLGIFRVWSVYRERSGAKQREKENVK
jgi:hypothetical protein